MTGTTRSSHGLDSRRRRALFRAWHRGMRELDLVLGGFADANIATVSDHDLADFEALMDLPDGDVLAWITGREPVPSASLSAIDTILQFQSRRHEDR